MKEGFCEILLATENTCQAPFAAIESPFSTYFMGACMPFTPWRRTGEPRRRASARAFGAKALHRIAEDPCISAIFPAGWRFRGVDGRAWGPVGLGPNAPNP